MANIYKNEIKCADKRELKKITKLILKQTPSMVSNKTENTVVFETRWKDLDYAMEDFSQEFPEVTFSCAYMHMTSCYDYFQTLKDYKNGVVTYKGLRPVFLNNSAELEGVNLKDYEDFVSI